MVTHSPLEPNTQSRMWSMAALAAEAAEDRPRASMMAAPRLPTVGMNTSWFEASALMISASRSLPTVAKRMSGYMVGEWLPQTIRFLMSATARPDLAASCDSARLWSRRSMAVKFLAGRSGADFMAMYALVLAGLPTTRTLTSR